MRSRRRRLSGLAQTGLLLFQGLALPIGVCAQGHEDLEPPDGAPHALATVPADDQGSVGGHAHGGHVTTAPGAGLGDATKVFGHDASDAHGPVPTECAAMSGCGTPALGEAGGAEISMTYVLTRRADRRDPGRPLVVDLGITTPPPKI